MPVITVPEKGDGGFLEIPLEFVDAEEGLESAAATFSRGKVSTFVGRFVPNARPEGWGEKGPPAVTLRLFIRDAASPGFSKSVEGL
jgi:hypothetical protein